MIYNLGRVVPLFKGTYDAATTYTFLDVVYYDNSSFVALDTTTGNLPTDTDHWLPVALKGTTQDPTPSQMQEIKTEVEQYIVQNTIVDNLNSTATDKSLSANMGNELGIRTSNSTFSETLIDSSNITIANGHVVVMSGVVNYGSTQSQTKHATVILPNVGEKRYVRFLGLKWAGSTTVSIGYAFYDANDNPISAARFPNNNPTVESAEYTVAVPTNATKLKTTVKRTIDISNSFYCYLQLGEKLNDTPDFTVNAVGNEVAKAQDVAINSVKLSDIDDGVLTKIDYTYITGYWNASTHSNSSSSNYISALVNIEGYDKIIFSVPYFATEVSSGFALFKTNTISASNNNLVYDEIYSANNTSSGWKTQTIDVLPEAKYLYTRLNITSGISPSTFVPVIYGYKGNTISNLINELAVSVDDLDYNTEVVPSGTNLIDVNNCLDNWTIKEGHIYSLTNGKMSNPLVLEDGKTYTIQGVEVYTPNATPQILYGRFRDNGAYDETGYVDRYSIKESNNGGHPIVVDDSYGSRRAGHTTFTYHNNGEAYIRFVIQYNTPFDLQKVQLEVGSEMTPPQEYESETVFDIAKKTELDKLTNRVNEIENEDSKTDSLMKVVIDNNNIIVRSKYSDDADIAILMSEKMLSGGSNRKAQSLTLNSVYIGSNQLNDDDLVSSSNRVSNITDSVGAIGVSTYWYLYAQHGWTIPRISKTYAPNITSDDIGSVWRDKNHTGRTFKIGYVGDYIYFIPEQTYNSTTQVYTSKWQKTNGFPEVYQYVSDGVHTTDINCMVWNAETEEYVNKNQRYDLRIQTAKRKYIVDNAEVGNGTYYCNDFVFNEYILGHNTGTVDYDKWLTVSDDSKFNGELINFTRSFVFKGSTIGYNSSLSVENPLKVSFFYGIIPQMPMKQTVYDDDGNSKVYHSFSYIPKCKTTEEPFNSDNGLPDKSGNRNSTDLYDVNDIPERCICYTKAASEDGGDYRIGMAGGYSLVDGITVPSIRNTYFNDYSSTIFTYGHDSDTLNKFYPYCLISSSFPNSIMPTTFTKDFCGFYSWFNPNMNPDGIQVFSYKSSDGYIVYIHAQSGFDKVAITLPSYLEGLKVDSVVESTSGSTVLNSIVSGCKLYAKFELNNHQNYHNYIVIKLK